MTFSMTGQEKVTF